MKIGVWSGRKAVVRLSSISPQPATATIGQVCHAWRSSQQKGNDGAPMPVQGESPVFELVPLESLPTFDAAKTLKTKYLTQHQIRRLNAFRSQWKYVIAVMLQLGNLLMLLTTTAPRSMGSVMALLAPILQFPGMVFIVASIRIEMLRLLFGTYDFWYFTVNNIIFGVCFTAMLSDIRVIIVIVGCAFAQISIGSDALVGDRRQLFISSIVNCGTHFAMFVAVFLRLVDDGGGGDRYLLSYSSTGNGFSIRDTLMNTQINMVLLFGRLVYRNWITIREQRIVKALHISPETSYIPGRRRCVSYYCAVGLRPKRDPTNVPNTIVRARRRSSIPTTTNTSRSTRSRAGSVISIQALDSFHAQMAVPAHIRVEQSRGESMVKGESEPKLDCCQHNRIRAQHHTKIKLQFVPIGEDFNAYKTLVPGFGRLLDRVLGPSVSCWRRQLLLYLFHVLGYIGIGVLVLGALAAWLSKEQNLDNLLPGLARTQHMALFASLVFCNVFFAAYQRQLLKRLYSSFNFIFLTTKLTVASLALCQFFAWDRRVIWVWGSWIWMQWALTLDALPPSAMRLLNFRRSTLMLFVLIIELTGLIILSLELFAFDRWIVPNRVVIDRVIMGHRVQVGTLSALVSRLWTIFLWDCKLIWFLTAALRRQRHRRLSSIDVTEANNDDEGERLLLTGSVEFFYEWVSHNRPKSRWLRKVHILRVTQAFMQRRTTAILHVENQ